MKKILTTLTLTCALFLPSTPVSAASASAVAFIHDRPNNQFMFIKAMTNSDRTLRNSYDWSSDGCSAPWYLSPHIAAYNGVFNSACQQHDFGYRNFAGQRRADPSNWRREQVDLRFAGNMNAACEATFWGPSNMWCKVGAFGYYSAVRAWGNVNGW